MDRIRELEQLQSEYPCIDSVGFLSEIDDWREEVCRGGNPNYIKELLIETLDTVEDAFISHLLGAEAIDWG